MMLLYEGEFKATDDGSVWVDQPNRDGESVVIQTALKQLVGHHVQFAMSHLPEMPVDVSKRGLGSCHVEGVCPYGHNSGNLGIYAVTANGVLHESPWRIEGFDGTVTEIRFEWMPGHAGRIACASLSELEKLRDSVANLKAQISGFSIGTAAEGK